MQTTATKVAALDAFLDDPTLRGNWMMQSSPAHRRKLQMLLGTGALLAIGGIAMIAIIARQPSGQASDTGWMGLGALLLTIGLGMIWRFASPFMFGLAISDDALMTRRLTGWHAIPWAEIMALIVTEHTRFGAREVVVRTQNASVHFGWEEQGEGVTFAPFELLEAGEARALTHTIQVRAKLSQKEPGVWLADGAESTLAWSGKFKW